MATLDGNIEPIYFLITSITFIVLSLIQYKNYGKTFEAIYLSGLSVFFLFTYFGLISVV
ncbi:hypothetical protein N9765_02480 [Candidatus Pelagibacter sp.]|nr:hypothetical protein [Candidatus Pelagibacter sp.]